MKRIKIEMYRFYMRYLVYSTDRLLARKERMAEKEAAGRNCVLTECRGRA